MRKHLFFLAFLMTIVMRASADDYFDTSSMSAQDKNAPIGWGAAVTGSEDENQVTVTTLEELQAALTGTDKKTIIVSGTITFTGRVTIEGVQNKSIYGRPGAILQNPTHTATKENTGILTLKNCSNIIIRNLTFKGAGAYDIDGNDNLTLQNCSNIWVDHCDFQDGVDGNFDCNNGSDNICVSWCRFRYLIAPWSGGSGGSNDHRFSDLWGGGDGNAEKDEGHLNTTFVNCWWDEGCKQRMPRVRFGKIHILNCLYSSSVADYCVGGGYKSNVYIEKCAFTNAAQNYPWKNFATGTNKDDPSITYYNYNVTFTGNSGVADGAQRMYDTDPYYTPSYTYDSYASDQVESVVSNATNGAGATLKLPSISGSVTWTIGNEASPTISAEITESVLTTGRTVGSGLAATAATYLESSMVAYQPSESNPGAVETAMVEYHVKVYPGLEFTPTSVSYNAVKDGTDYATYSWSYTLDGVESAITQVSKDDIVRNSNSTGNPAMLHTHVLSASQCSEFTFRIYVSGFANKKKLGIGNVVINGKVSGEKAALDNYTVTYENNDGNAYGTAPAAVDVTQYKSTTIPVNTTLYKNGYTLTGWNDGTSTYAIGEDYTPTGTVTMHPVFTANDKTLSDIPLEKTVTWYFGKSNGAPDYNGTATAQVKQITIGGSTIDLGVKMAGGSNDGRGDEWMNNQQKNMTVPVVKNAVVKAKVYYTSAATINGENIPYDESYGTEGNVVYTYTYTGDDPAEIAVNVGNQFLSYISVTYPGTGDPWANFADFSAIINNQSGTLLTAAEMAAQGNAVSFGVIDNNGVTERVAADNEDAIATISGIYHNDHGCTNVNVVVPVPGPVMIGVGQCTYSSNNILVKEGSTTILSKTPATACWKNDHSKITYLYYTGNATTLTITGMNFCPFISVASAPLYTITGTISGGNINGKQVIFTSELTGQTFEATVANNAFTLNVPADTYTVTLSDNNYVISNPTSIVVTAANAVTVTIEAASAQTVTGAIANAPTEAFTLTFTGANHTETVDCAAGATSFTKDLMPDTYVMSSNVGTLSPLSVESFKVVKDAVTHNIYFPEAAVPAATSANITVDNTATVAANIYNTVSDALAAAKAGSISSPVITLTSGQTYREQVIVDQANVTLKTSGTEKATITWYYGIGYSYYSLNDKGYYDKDRAMTRNSIKMIDPARWGTTVLVKSTGNGFKAENIIFENSFNQYYTTEEVADGVRPNGVQSINYNRTLTSGQTGYKAADSKDATERAAAIAFENDPTGCQLYNCEFRGSQDTFYSSGKLYVKKCNIIGNTDYIFGGGYVVFDDCDLTIGGYSDSQNTAYITAYKAGETLDASKKYVFRDCTVKATDRAYVSANLGRDWGGAAASVYFFNLKNEIGNNMSYTWNDMGGGVSAGTADLHIYDFDPAINSNYNTTGSNGANINGLVSDADALSLYTGVVTNLGFTPEHIYDIPLDESSYYNTLRIKASNNGEGNVTLTRSIAADKWSTICLPFAMTSAQLKSTFGNDVNVAALTGGNETTMYFTSLDLTNDATTTTANQPYAIKVGTAFSTATINGVTVVEGTPGQDAIDGWTFSGNYIKTNVPLYAYFFQNNYLKQASGTGVSLKPFRGYFTYVTPQAGREVLFDLDSNSATGINTLDNFTISPFDNDAPIFNLAGQRVTKNYKGVVIVNGKKVVRK